MTAYVAFAVVGKAGDRVLGVAVRAAGFQQAVLLVVGPASSRSEVFNPHKPGRAAIF